jgi:DNA-binding LacI/PurR family transcriptional regulator
MKGYKRRYWRLDRFPDLGVEWFHQRGVSIPEQVYEIWQQWIKEDHTPETKFRKALALAVGIEVAAVGHYLSYWTDPGTNRIDHVSFKTRKDLDEAAESLGCPPPHPFLEPLGKQEGGHLRILLLAELTSVPSPRYHLTVLKSIAEACDRLNISVEIRELNQADPDMSGSVTRLVRSSFPEGIIWLRLTPDQACLDAISRYSMSLPCVLVHASRFKYPRPVLAHVVPDQADITKSVKTWVGRLPCVPFKDRKVVVVAMEPERCHPTFQSFNEGVPISIRSERIELAMNGVRSAGMEPVIEYVGTYAASQASYVLGAQPTALGYLCLSDEIAVSVQQLLAARNEEIRGRVLGFDGSDLAAEYQIPSFDQRLEELGEQVVKPFIAWFRGPRKSTSNWPAFREVAVRLGPPALLNA